MVRPLWFYKLIFRKLHPNPITTVSNHYFLPREYICGVEFRKQKLKDGSTLLHLREDSGIWLKQSDDEAALYVPFIKWWFLDYLRKNTENVNKQKFKRKLRALK